MLAAKDAHVEPGRLQAVALGRVAHKATKQQKPIPVPHQEVTYFFQVDPFFPGFLFVNAFKSHFAEFTIVLNGDCFYFVNNWFLIDGEFVLIIRVGKRMLCHCLFTASPPQSHRLVLFLINKQGLLPVRN